MKYTSFKRYKFSTILKYLNLEKYSISRFYRYFVFKRYNFSRLYRYIHFKRYNFSRIYKYINYKKTKLLLFYLSASVIFLVISYLSIPAFFKYDKSKLENIICKDFNVKCSIEGKVNYSLIPSPNIKIKNLIIKDLVNKKKTIGEVENISIKLSVYNLFDKESLVYKKIKLDKSNFYFDLNKYKDFFGKELSSKPITLKNGEINFFDGQKFIAAIKNVRFKSKNGESTLKGNIFNDEISINLKNEKNKNQLLKNFTLKLVKAKLLVKIELNNSKNDKNLIEGKGLFKMNKNRLTSIFEYKNNQINFKKTNLRNFFLDGKLEGNLEFLPYLNFDLNVELNSINFNRLYSYLVALGKKSKRNLFKINKKINGQIHLTGEKIFSKYTLIDSFESRLKFINGNILVEQLLLNLGKLGAADISGIVNNDKKNSNLKFENNIFLDNVKRFYNKFGIYNKQKIPANLFVSGNIDLDNLILRLNEVSNEEKFSEEDVSYIEKEFNDTLLEDGYATLFNFKILKEFVKSINADEN